MIHKQKITCPKTARALLLAKKTASFCHYCLLINEERRRTSADAKRDVLNFCFPGLDERLTLRFASVLLAHIAHDHQRFLCSGRDQSLTFTSQSAQSGTDASSAHLLVGLSAQSVLHPGPLHLNVLVLVQTLLRVLFHFKLGF